MADPTPSYGGCKCICHTQAGVMHMGPCCTRPESTGERLTKKPPKITSEFALVDILKGRKALEKYLRTSEGLRFTMEGVLRYPFGNDDGTSIEFVADVTSLKVHP